MLPNPILKYFPKIYQKDAKAITLASKMDTHLAAWGKDVIDMRRFIRADECTSALIKELDFLLYARVKDTDSDAVKRQKIASAIESHKYRGTWQYDARYRIENITGVMPNLYMLLDSDDNIRLAHLADDPDNFWATRGKDDSPFSELGEWRIGDFTEPVIAGNIYIDLVSSTLTSDELDAVVAELQDDCFPAYMRGFLGYGVSTVPVYDPRLELHNRFETESGGIIPSTVGVNFTGTPTFGTGVFGNARASGVITATAVPAGSVGCVEMHIKPVGWSWDGVNASDANFHFLFYALPPLFFVAFQHGSGFQFDIFGSGISPWDTTITLTAGVWTHFAFTWSVTDSRLRIYQDNVLKVDFNAWTPGYAIPATFNIGIDDSVYPFTGLTDNIKIWNYEKSNFTDRTTEYSIVYTTGGWASYGRIIY